MKKIFTLFAAVSIGSLGFAQTVFQSDLSSWASGDPTDWMGAKTSISASNVVEVTTGANYGTKMASLINTGNSHKRFTTQPVTVVAGETYDITMWVSGVAGEIRTAFYDATNSSYSAYGNYVTLTSTTQTTITQTVTLPATCTSAEFILSLRKTDAAGIILDSVAVVSSTPPVATVVTIHDIQFTAANPADSPYNGQLIETSGIVTGVQYNGYYLQDGNGSWNGVFVLDYNNVPNRGDDVTVTGTVDEYFNFTTVKNITVYNATAGGTMPMATALSTLNANNEEYEGVLVNVTNANCTADTTSNANREWTINDASGALMADDKMFIYSPAVGTVYNVTGIMDYSFSNAKILPRDASDISIATSINELENVTVSVYPNPASDNINFNLNINNATVNVLDITGKSVKTITSTSQSFNINLGGLENGIYFYQVIDNNNNIVATNKFIISK